MWARLLTHSGHCPSDSSNCFHSRSYPHLATETGPQGAGAAEPHPSAHLGQSGHLGASVSSPSGSPSSLSLTHYLLGDPEDIILPSAGVGGLHARTSWPEPWHRVSTRGLQTVPPAERPSSDTYGPETLCRRPGETLRPQFPLCPSGMLGRLMRRQTSSCQPRTQRPLSGWE